MKTKSISLGGYTGEKRRFLLPNVDELFQIELNIQGNIFLTLFNPLRDSEDNYWALVTQPDAGPPISAHMKVKRITDTYTASERLLYEITFLGFDLEED